MNQILSLRRFGLGIVLGAIAGAAVLVAAYAGTASAQHAPKGALVALRKTTLGSVLGDASGRTVEPSQPSSGGYRPGGGW